MVVSCGMVYAAIALLVGAWLPVTMTDPQSRAMAGVSAVPYLVPAGPMEVEVPVILDLIVAALAWISHDRRAAARFVGVSGRTLTLAGTRSAVERVTGAELMPHLVGKPAGRDWNRRSDLSCS